MDPEPTKWLILTLDHIGGLKIEILKFGLRHVLSLSKLGLEPTFNEAETFGD